MTTRSAWERELVRAMLYALVQYDRKENVRSVTRRVPGWLCGVFHVLWCRTDYVVCVAPQTYALTHSGFRLLFPNDAELFDQIGGVR